MRITRKEARRLLKGVQHVLELIKQEEEIKRQRRLLEERRLLEKPAVTVDYPIETDLHLI